MKIKPIKGQPNIRWDTKTQQELSKYVSKWNAKLTRLSKNNPDKLDYLPERTSVQYQKEFIFSRKDFNDFKKHVDNFMKIPDKKVEFIVTQGGAKTTNYELKETKRLIKNENISRAKAVKKIAPSTTKGNMGTIKDNNLKPIKATPELISPTYWKSYVRGAYERKMSGITPITKEKYKQNYLRKINEHLGAFGEQLHMLIESLPAEVLFDNYYEDETMQIQFTSDPLDPQLINDLAVLRWKQFLDKKKIKIDEDIRFKIETYLNLAEDKN